MNILLKILKTDTVAKSLTQTVINASPKFLKDMESWLNKNGDGKLKPRRTRLLTKISSQELKAARNQRLPMSDQSE